MKMDKVRKLWGVGLALLAGTAPGAASARGIFEFQTPVTPVAHETLAVHNLFLTIIGWVYGIGIVFLLVTLLLHRRRPGHAPAKFTGPRTPLQWLLCTAPFLALMFTDYVIMGIPAWHAQVAMADTRTDAGMVVKVTGHQWYWEYGYPDANVSYTSKLSTPQAERDGTAPKNPNYLLEVDRPLVLPVGVKVRVLLTSADVIHSWWVPSFGIKQDAVPGFLRESWVKIEKAGTYRGQCGELCGMEHAYMPIVVEARDPADFKAWLAAQQSAQAATAAASSATLSKDELLAKGKVAYEKTCAVCHQTTGLGVPGAFPPIAGGQAFAPATPEMAKALADRGFYAGGKIVVGPRDKHIGIVLNGITGTPMAAFGSQLSDADIAAIVTYERNSFGNTTGDLVQPADVKAARGAH